MKKHLSITIASILAFSVPGIANAQFIVNPPLSVSDAIGGIPSVSGATLETFNSASPSILTLSGNAQLVTGPNYSIAYIPPSFSGSTAAYFGEPVVSGYNNYPWDGSQYVAVWDGGSATLSFSTPQQYLGLLWGTVDLGNTLTFYDNANNVIGTVTGAQITGVNYTDWGPGNTAYVNIISTTPFSSVVATFAGGGHSFEFDDVAYAPVPEPASVLLVGIGLAGLRFGLRRKSA